MPRFKNKEQMLRWRRTRPRRLNARAGGFNGGAGAAASGQPIFDTSFNNGSDWIFSSADRSWIMDSTGNGGPVGQARPLSLQVVTDGTEAKYFFEVEVGDISSINFRNSFGITEEDSLASDDGGGLEGGFPGNRCWHTTDSGGSLSRVFGAGGNVVFSGLTDWTEASGVRLALAVHFKSAGGYDLWFRESGDPDIAGWIGKSGTAAAVGDPENGTNPITVGAIASQTYTVALTTDDAGLTNPAWTIPETPSIAIPTGFSAWPTA